MYLDIFIVFSVSEVFEFRRNWHVLGRYIRVSYTRPLALSRATIYKECRPRNEFIYVELCSTVQDSTRFYPSVGSIFDLQGLSKLYPIKYV